MQALGAPVNQHSKRKRAGITSPFFCIKPNVVLYAAPVYAALVLRRRTAAMPPRAVSNSNPPAGSGTAETVIEAM